MKNDDVLKILQKRHRRSLWLPVLFVAATGALAAVLVLIFLSGEGSFFKPEPTKLFVWLSVLAASVAAAGLAFWLRRRSLSRTAAEWDCEIDGKNRLEAAAELAATETPLARAQREESGQYLARAGGLRRSWLVPAVAALVVLLCLAQLLLVSVWVVDLALHGWPSPVAVEEKPPQARFTWLKPKSEIKAAPLEEVPLSAQASSSSGLEKVTLEISLNGSAKKLSVPIEEKFLTQPGENRLELSVFLDELEAEPFDIVSYHLQGRRITKASLPAVSSDLQFIQVRPLRDEALERDGGEGSGGKCLALLLKLKIAQLGLLKGNHVLSTAELERTNPAWTGENTRVGGEQDTLAGKTREVVDFFIANDAPLQAVDWLKQSIPEMEKAGRSIREIKNPTAVPHQEKALSLITSCEKLFVKVLVRKSSPGEPKKKLKDPFEDEQKYQLTKRSETAAGELEQMAQKQSELNEEMSSPSSKPGAEGEKSQQQAAREKEIAEKLGGLAGSLPPEVSETLKAAQAKAGEAAGHLEVGDPEAGAQAGTETLARMQKALATLRAAGEVAAADKLAGAQQDLNQAAGQAAEAEKGNAPGQNAADAAGKLAETREALKAEAQRQQKEGSAEAAQRLADMVNKISEQGVGKDLKKVAEGETPGGEGKETPSEKISGLAREAGKGSLATLASVEARKKTAEELARGAKMLKRLTDPAAAATGPGTTAEVVEHMKAQLQNAESVVQAPDQRDQARKILKNIPDQTPGITPTSVVVFYEKNHAAIEELIAHLLTVPASESRENAFTVVSETEVPEPYREPVARYFEELSRQSKTATP